MSDFPKDEEPDFRIRFSEIEFPSDALSVKRLRTLFPAKFDDGSAVTTGTSTFFDPIGAGEPLHLKKLNDLICNERTVAEFAFYNAIDPYPSETLDDRCKADIEADRQELAKLYQEFRLADSPEAARFLIQHIEEQASKQGHSVKSRGRQAFRPWDRILLIESNCVLMTFIKNRWRILQPYQWCGSRTT